MYLPRGVYRLEGGTCLGVTAMYLWRGVYEGVYEGGVPAWRGGVWMGAYTLLIAYNSAGNYECDEHS